MLIPLGTDRPLTRKPVVTRALIALNLGVFLLVAVLARIDVESAERIVQWGQVARRPFTVHGLFTSAFFHAGFMHIFGNMVFLLVFGPSVEDRMGRPWYLLFYLAGAAVSGLAHISVESSAAIGASGAVAAVSGAFLVLFPRTRVRCFVIFIFIGIFMVPSWWLIGLYIVLDMVQHVFTPANGIANMAHLGGYAFGVILALVLLLTRALPQEPYDLLSIFRQRQRRRAFVNAQKLHTQSMDRIRSDAAPSDPRSEQLARARARVGELLSTGRRDEAADEYLRLVDEFGVDGRAPLTLHRDAQYEVANTLYQRGQQVQAAEAFQRLLGSYPNDPERHLISVLIARVKAEQLGDTSGAVAMLSELLTQGLAPETRTLVENELQRIRGDAAPNTPPGNEDPTP